MTTDDMELVRQYAAHQAGTVKAEPFVLSELPPKVCNRQISSFTEIKRIGLHLDERDGDGHGWWPEIKFGNGTIEFDVRGTNVFQKSFVGVAFHGFDENTYDAIYFRPFNFRAEDPARRFHGVQYIAQPTYTWDKLRAEYPGKYAARANRAFVAAFLVSLAQYDLASSSCSWSRKARWSRRQSMAKFQVTKILLCIRLPANLPASEF